ncbi:MAG: hypothetical protein KC643_04830 [Nitrospira sp.]|nr:hypothetical protein [Nitrospira sp.]
MKSWIAYVFLFLLGIGLGLGAPMFVSQYAQAYLPQFFKDPVHPLKGTVTHKQRDQDRLLMTITTSDGTILATFRQQIPEIDLLIEVQDSVTLNVKAYEPFVNDPPVLNVKKTTVNAIPAIPASLPRMREEEALSSTPPSASPNQETPALEDIPTPPTP